MEVWSSEIMASECFEEYFVMWSTASSTEKTVLMDILSDKNSVPKCSFFASWTSLAG